MTTGCQHTCAVRTTGAATCWGYDLQGQLGNGATSRFATPMTVAGVSTATAVDPGYDHTCALLAEGTVRCWGFN